MKQQELTKLRAELERQKVMYEEGLSKEKSRHTIEVKVGLQSLTWCLSSFRISAKTANRVVVCVHPGFVKQDTTFWIQSNSLKVNVLRIHKVSNSNHFTITHMVFRKWSC